MPSAAMPSAAVKNDPVDDLLSKNSGSNAYEYYSDGSFHYFFHLIIYEKWKVKICKIYER